MGCNYVYRWPIFKLDALIVTPDALVENLQPSKLRLRQYSNRDNKIHAR